MRMGLLQVADNGNYFWCWFLLALIVSLCLALVPLFYKKSKSVQSDQNGLLTSTKYSIDNIRNKKKLGFVGIGLSIVTVIIGLLCGINIFISLMFGVSLLFAALPNLMYGSLKAAYCENDGLRVTDLAKETLISFEEIKRAYIYGPKGGPGEVVIIKLKKSNLFGRSFSIVPAHMPRFFLLLQKHGIELGGYKYHEGYYRSHSEL